LPLSLPLNNAMKSRTKLQLHAPILPLFCRLLNRFHR
jgi:hypothetical protein